MKVVTVKFGKVQVGCRNIKSLGAWVTCDKQKNRQEGIFFSLACIELVANLSSKIVRREVKGPTSSLKARFCS